MFDAGGGMDHQGALTAACLVCSCRWVSFQMCDFRFGESYTTCVGEIDQRLVLTQEAKATAALLICRCGRLRDT